MSLVNKSCTPCEVGAVPLSAEEVTISISAITGWVANEESSKIMKTFKFKNFLNSLNFVNLIGSVAEDENHHPDITFGWGYVRVVIYTHKIDGLHENDFILAAKIDQINSNSK